MFSDESAHGDLRSIGDRLASPHLRDGQVQHHPLVSLHDPAAVSCPSSFDCDFLGVKTRRAFVSGMVTDTAREARPLSYPPFDEEYFEWLDMLESIEQASETFVMIELGAGYGRWCVRAAAALRRRPDCRYQLVAVEAEPVHFRWIHDHFRDNGIDPNAQDLIWAAVGAKPGFVPFWVGAADGWYGQAIAPLGEWPPLPDVGARRRLKARSALGRPPATSSNDRTVTWIPCVTLADVIAPYPKVDLIDLDIQGAEYDVLASAIELVNKRVLRLHIGTHSPQVEEQLRQLFTTHKWQLVHDYPCQTTSETAYGPIHFSDGVQTWVNPIVPTVSTPFERPVRTSKKRAEDEPKVLASLRNLRSEVKELKQQNRALKRRNSELRERNRAREEQLRALHGSRAWPLRIVEKWFSKRRRS